MLALQRAGIPVECYDAFEIDKYAVTVSKRNFPVIVHHGNVQHSRCYTEYGLRRTGCVGCPFSKHINEELAIIEKHEPMLYKAAVNIFSKSYEYTAKYRAFVKEMKAKEKEQKKKDV